MIEKKYVFRGGVRIGFLSTTWPSGILEVNENLLTLRSEMTKQELAFSKSDIIKIEIKKVFPIIGYGIRIHHTKTSYSKKIYFWYWSFRFKELTDALKELGWLS
ncbi:hypothetical protein A3D42_00700 [Candidatus Nomurabacteria bacterium RIFCSPHIGHO2_02_FULL_41_18]|uniref:Uncharacterized protein n=1 Tax=Candidatus Nomurabacteria bacterium RIFCSPHIGHO2_02_FULL_41_18 TaxID=1801754 RepID=A0A1F6W7C1_9BACT|nr:MAG: hypothetical protein A2737_03025 [Candidatus Nomurabacteria bacterium RIFCSPHIGHO2_01_FULL_41_71]OGI77803.1 MAG: hypothetical protein A3D42_00700 [Candidatus Nomurabacteria bacterium RIFCSPHIGHO2_02_FULL_41_18]OGI89930.1 MAG: hypothetical protein A3B01_01650 [Candidatus Nomurabacteria bacterium RIFCSPLOWO2_01_FULL_41_52b]OGJ00171.1 MAG: hypothetical protein A3I90_03010 [Candidatus Nomurabacteria bacterium RIFCSPLOWO2_02_FULL_41_9]